jgi:hypothetical protein
MGKGIGFSETAPRDGVPTALAACIASSARVLLPLTTLALIAGLASGCVFGHAGETVRVRGVIQCDGAGATGQVRGEFEWPSGPGVDKVRAHPARYWQGAKRLLLEDIDLCQSASIADGEFVLDIHRTFGAVFPFHQIMYYLGDPSGSPEGTCLAFDTTEGVWIGISAWDGERLVLLGARAEADGTELEELGEWNRVGSEPGLGAEEVATWQIAIQLHAR